MAEDNKKRILDSSFPFVDNFPFVVPRSKKKSQAKNVIDFYDNYYRNDYFDDERREKMRVNYDLYNGRWPDMDNVSLRKGFTIQGENVGSDAKGVKHFPVMDRVAKSIYGDIVFQPLVPIVFDTSSYSVNQRKKFLADLIKQRVNETIIEPERQRITQQYLVQMGIQDVYSLSPEEQMQMSSDIENRLQQATVREIKEFMSTYQTPEQKQAQALIDYMVYYLDMKNKFNQGGEHAIITGEEYYRIGIAMDEPFMKVLHPEGVTYDLSQRNEFVEDGQFAKYEQFLTITDVANEYVGEIKLSELKKLQQLYAPFPGGGIRNRGNNPHPDGIERKLLNTAANNPEIQKINLKTTEGQEKYKQLLMSIDPRTSDVQSIRECYVTWKWLRKLYVVTREVGGEMIKLIQDESYIKNPALDLDVKTIYINDVWEGTALGDNNDVFCRVRQVPYQHKSLSDPRDSKLTIYGATYNTIQGSSKNISLMDPAKPWQYRYNVCMERLEEFESTNIGKVLLGTATMKPANWSWSEWFSSFVNGKVALINTHKDGITAFDSQFFKSIDLGNTMDIAAQLQQLEFNMNQIFSSMYYNPSKLGQISPYITSSNNRMNIAQADRQLAKFYERHRVIKERVLRGVLHMARVAYKKNPIKRSIILDDFSQKELELDAAMLDRAELGLFVVDNFVENEKLERLRAEIKTMLQNRYGTLKDIVRVNNAKSTSELMAIAEEIEEKQAEMAAQNRKAEAENAQQEHQKDLEKIQMQEGFRAKRESERNRVLIETAKLDSMKFAIQNDIDQNNVNDFLQKLELELADKERKRQWESEEAEKERQWKSKENEKDRNKL